MEYTVNRFAASRFTADTTRINLCESFRWLAPKTNPPQIQGAEQIEIEIELPRIEIPHRAELLAYTYYNRDPFLRRSVRRSFTIIRNNGLNTNSDDHQLETKKQWAQQSSLMTTNLKKQIVLLNTQEFWKIV